MSKKPGKKSTKKKNKNNKKSSHWFKRISILFLLISIFIFISYLGYLDFTVRKQFSGKRWSIPAKVYASPVEIFAGYQSRH